jgi:hypothetical protein
MPVRTFARSQANPLPFTLHTFPHPSLARGAGAEEVHRESGPDEAPMATGCLRGICWAIAIEAVAGAVLFALWHFRHLLL